MTEANIPDELTNKIIMMAIPTYPFMDELKTFISYWCDEQLQALYSKSRPSHTALYNYFSNHLNDLNDYEDHLFLNLTSQDLLNIINDIE